MWKGHRVEELTIDLKDKITPVVLTEINKILVFNICIFLCILYLFSEIKKLKIKSHFDAKLFKTEEEFWRCVGKRKEKVTGC